MLPDGRAGAVTPSIPRSPPKSDRREAAAGPTACRLRTTIDLPRDGESSLRRFTLIGTDLIPPSACPAGPDGSCGADRSDGTPYRADPASNQAAWHETSDPVPVRPGLPHARSAASGVTAIVEGDPPTSDRHQIIVFRPGEGIPALLHATGMGADDVAAVASILASSRSADAEPERLELLRAAGDRGTGRPLRLTLIRAGGFRSSVALDDRSRYVSAVVPAPANARVVGHKCTTVADPSGLRGRSVEASLHAAAAAVGLDGAIVDRIVEAYGNRIAWDAAVRPTDRVEMLLADEALSWANLLAVTVTASGRQFTLQRFATADDGDIGAYDVDGQSVTQSLLRKPVEAGRLGDGFGWRIHPILHDRRFHNGVDYAAPLGSPIQAAGSGRVITISEQPGYGKYIRVMHDAGFETTYAHIANVAAGMRVGVRVRQGETIATIGSTGLSTGPHLYYELRAGGLYKDPLRSRLNSGRILDGLNMSFFRSKIAERSSIVARIRRAQDTL